MGKYFGTDGVRGKFEKEVTTDIAYRIGRFLGCYPLDNHNKILIARDTRMSGNLLLSALVKGVVDSGGIVYDEGISSTPSISYLVNKHPFDFGIMISASHNPYYDNGIKVFNAQGEKISAEIELLIEQYIDTENDYLPIQNGQIINDNHLLNEYQDFLQNIALDLSELKIIVDCANGSASSIAPELFRKLNINCRCIHCSPNGLNINERCGSTHLDSLIEEIKKEHYDLGFAFDGDADRLLVVAPDGKIIDGDMIIYLIAKYLKDNDQLNNNKVVITIMSNLGLKKSLDALNIDYEITPVGDKYVQAKIKELNLSLGGEQSGHVILSNHLNTGDGILCALVLMNIIVSTNKSIDELLKDLVVYPQLLVNIKVPNKDLIMADVGLNDLINKLNCEVLKENGRILLRASGTESLIRVMCEAETKPICEYVCTKLTDYIQNLIK